jgi:hypothetical protein
MNGVAKLYERSAPEALDNLVIADKLGKAIAHTYNACWETMGSLQSHDPNT